MTTITDPGVYDLDEATYHADPVPGGSLSSTGARRILDSPARFRWEREHRIDKKVFDVGHAVHAKVLGVGMEVVAIPDDLLAVNGAASTKDAKAFIAEARAAGQVPLKSDEAAPIDAMAEAVLTHPDARVFLERNGQAEASAFARDPQTGAWLRVRPDFLPDHDPGRRTVLVDLKTGRTANPAKFGKAAHDFHYEQQDDLYRRVTQLARGEADAAFVFVLVETEPPHLVSVVELDVVARRIGAERNRRAIDLYDECTRTDTWPGYPRGVSLVALPCYAETAHEELFA